MNADTPQKPATERRKTPTAHNVAKYRKDGRSVILNILLTQSILIAFVVGFLLYNNFFAPKNVRYFAATPIGQIIPMEPLDRPIDSDPVVLGWVANAASDVMTFTYLDYNDRLGKAQSYFTTHGWQSFLLGLHKANYLSTLIENKQIQSTVPKEAPRIVDRCVDSCNPYFWSVQIPLLISVESQDKHGDSNRLVTLKIVRVPPVDNPAGIQIDDWKEE